MELKNAKARGSRHGLKNDGSVDCFILQDVGEEKYGMSRTTLLQSRDEVLLGDKAQKAVNKIDDDELDESALSHTDNNEWNGQEVAHHELPVEEPEPESAIDFHVTIELEVAESPEILPVSSAVNINEL